MEIKDLLKFEKTYSTKNMYILELSHDVDGVYEVNRIIIRGPIIKNEKKVYEVMPNMETLEIKDELIESHHPLRNIFPDLKRISVYQINSILETLYQGDLIRNHKIRKKIKKLSLQK